ncbi:hypothetical protein KKD70_03045 [Patescibacteria group bacterium]|nr:hypothetical protein [Patescibacteria group bacterium]
MALVMTMILVPILLTLGASFVDPITRSYRAAASDQKTVLAKNVAENLYETALEETRDLGVGDDGSSGAIAIEEDYGSGTGEWWVFGSPELDDDHTFEEASRNWYTIPAAGSGNAGGDYCSTKDPAVTIPEVKNKLLELGVNTSNNPTEVTFGDDPFEWPCHWNKLYEGQTVSIPLYVDGIDGVKNPVDLGLVDFELRVRAACDPDIASGENEIYKGEICNSNERYVLDDDGDVATNKPFTVIVVWEIVGTEVTTESNIVLASIFDEFDPFRDTTIKILNITNYQFASLIETWNPIDNDGNDNVSLINHLIEGCSSNPNCDHLEINKPILNFTLIHSLQDVNGNSVPYLEYQFRTPVVEPNPSIASNEKLVRTEVMLDGGYSETIEKSIDLTKPVTGFVIQQ